MSSTTRREDALRFHEEGQPGKIEVIPTKPLSTQRDLALAYSPGVAEPCLEIAANKDNVYKYTAKGNLVAVISNGTAVLGLGNIGPEASKPVMEGKGVLFKKFAGIDVFDIEVDCEDADEFIRIVKALEPTFGGVNLEDIKAPESFKIEQELRKQMKIPVMHDDQHGTAIISAAALLNALEVAHKKIDEIQVVVNGAGAAAISCALLYLTLGIKQENLVMLDTKGVLHIDRTDLNESKKQFATTKPVHTLAEALVGADVFLGLSTGNVMTAEMLLSMAKNPIVFACANPDPEIPYELAMATRSDVIMATGRSDHPNQVNNVLGFPYIFRGALDVRATEINEVMKLAAVKALAELTKQPVPEIVSKAYGLTALNFGKEYLIPKPLDPRLITTISPAVAKAAIDSGVARNPISDWTAYEYQLKKRIGIDNELISRIITRAKKDPKKVVFSEGDDPKILKSARILLEESICIPVLLGDVELIKSKAQELKLDLTGAIFINPLVEVDKQEHFGKLLHHKRQRKGITPQEGVRLMKDRNYYGSMMVESGEADAFISGLTRDYPSSVMAPLRVIGQEEGIRRVAGMYILINKKGPYFFADTTLNINPTAEELVDITTLTARAVQFFDVEPQIALLSYSNFGSAKGEGPEKVAKATAILKKKFPELKIDGEMQANIAINPQLQQELYPFSSLAATGANTLIFPNLESGNIAYKLIQEMGGAEVIGPVLMGMNKPVHILQLGSSVNDIVNMAAIAVVDAQNHALKHKI